VPVVNGEWNLSTLGDQVGQLETTGQAPGTLWPCVIAGHVTNRVMQDGRLPKSGDCTWRYASFRLGGTDYTYAVRNKLSAQPKATVSCTLRIAQRLLLVTCDTWDYLNFTYAKRLVIEAELTGQAPTP